MSINNHITSYNNNILYHKNRRCCELEIENKENVIPNKSISYFSNKHFLNNINNGGKNKLYKLNEKEQIQLDSKSDCLNIFKQEISFSFDYINIKKDIVHLQLKLKEFNSSACPKEEYFMKNFGTTYIIDNILKGNSKNNDEDEDDDSGSNDDSDDREAFYLGNCVGISNNFNFRSKLLSTFCLNDQIRKKDKFLKKTIQFQNLHKLPDYDVNENFNPKNFLKKKISQSETQNSQNPSSKIDKNHYNLHQNMNKNYRQEIPNDKDISKVILKKSYNLLHQDIKSTNSTSIQEKTKEKLETLPLNKNIRFSKNDNEQIFEADESLLNISDLSKDDSSKSSIHINSFNGDNNKNSDNIIIIRNLDETKLKNENFKNNKTSEMQNNTLNTSDNDNIQNKEKEEQLNSNIKNVIIKSKNQSDTTLNSYLIESFNLNIDNNNKQELPEIKDNSAQKLYQANYELNTKNSSYLTNSQKSTNEEFNSSKHKTKSDNIIFEVTANTNDNKSNITETNTISQRKSVAFSEKDMVVQFGEKENVKSFVINYNKTHKNSILKSNNFHFIVYIRKTKL